MKTLSISASAAVAGLFVMAAVAGCGGDPKEVVQPTEPTATAAPAPPAPTATASAAPTASAAASADAAAPPKPQNSGRPIVLKQDDKEITDSFGSSPGAKLVLGSDKEMAVLKIPEQALRVATNITFKLDAKGKSGGGQVGKIYRVTPIIPPASTSTTVESGGPPFELQFPAGSKKDANLAIGTFTVDAKGREKLVWTIQAPTRIDDVTNVAFFEVTSLSDAFLHVTTKPPPKK